MDKHLQSLNNSVIEPIIEQLSQFTELPSLTRFYLLTAAAISFERNGAFFQSDSENYALFQITEQQHIDLWDTHLVKTPDLASKIRGLASQHQFLKAPHQELNININYAAAIAAYALSKMARSFETGLTLHQQIAMFNQAFPGFKGVSRKEWQDAQCKLAEQPLPKGLPETSTAASNTTSQDTLAVCA